MSESAERRIAYVTPFRLPSNRYMELQKALLSDCGYEPRPFSLRHLILEGGIWGLLRRRNIVMVQWLETRPFGSGAAFTHLSTVGVLLFATYLILLAVSPAAVVYVVHDHAVHDTEGTMRALSQWFIVAARRVADFRVAHDPGAQTQYQATYLPHPLFWDSGAEGLAASHTRRKARPPGAPLRCAMLGAIRSYKSIDSVLKVWPAGLPLTVAGRCTPALLAELQSIIDARSLRPAVTLIPTFQSHAEFDRHLSVADVLILPHATGSAMVSGAFFEAIGRVPLILARRTRFMEWVAGELDGVHLFDRVEEIPALLERLSGCPSEVSRDTIERARALFGWEACHRQWGDFFRSIEHARSGVASRTA